MYWRESGKCGYTNDTLLVDVDWDDPKQSLCVSIGAGSFAMTLNNHCAFQLVPGHLQ